MGYEPPTFSAFIELKRDRVHYRIEDQWTVFNVQDIQLIGEFSAPPGVLAADYFFSFRLRDSGRTIDIPAYADGLFELLADLKTLLPGISAPELQMSTDFASKVLYPAHVAGMELYAFDTETKPLINLPLLRKVAQTQKVVKGIRPEVLEAVY